MGPRWRCLGHRTLVVLRWQWDGYEDHGKCAHISKDALPFTVDAPVVASFCSGDEVYFPSTSVPPRAARCVHGAFGLPATSCRDIHNVRGLTSHCVLCSVLELF